MCKKVISHGHVSTICSVCKQKQAEVDIEVVNLTAKDVVSLPSCVLCATNMCMRSWRTIYTDTDNLLFSTLGTVGGSIELTN